MAIVAAQGPAFPPLEEHVVVGCCPAASEACLSWLVVAHPAREKRTMRARSKRIVDVQVNAGIVPHLRTYCL